jgi:hypothetical protein
MMTALHIPIPPEALPRSYWGYAFRGSGFADSHFLQKHVNWNRVPFAQVRFSTRGHLFLLDKHSWRRKSQIMNALCMKRDALPCPLQARHIVVNKRSERGYAG